MDFGFSCFLFLIFKLNSRNDYANYSLNSCHVKRAEKLDRQKAPFAFQFVLRYWMGWGWRRLDCEGCPFRYFKSGHLQYMRFHDYGFTSTIPPTSHHLNGLSGPLLRSLAMCTENFHS